MSEPSSARIKIGEYLNMKWSEHLVSNLEIETIRDCNASCSYCPRQSEGFEKGVRLMDSDLLDSIISQISSIGPGGVPRICPFGQGEPFLDPRMPSIVKRLNEEVPWAGVTMFTNGSLFTKELLKELKGTWFQSVFLTLPTLVEEDYHTLTGLDLEETAKSIDLFAEAVSRGWIRVKFNIYIQDMLGIYTSDLVRAAMVKAWNRWPMMLFAHSKKQSYLGLCEETIAPSESHRMCWRINDLVILSGGSVPLCCQDVNCTVKLGDLNKDSLLDVIQSPVRETYLNQDYRSKIPCNKCNIEVIE